ncbi:MAG: SCO family protein [Deltaproteobacteria bacterium]|nr:SCO family protein [Deltaproteobacteria bacterium]MCB9788292.1 SCO family protein [Deltaproteobacteria bacterium]
MSAMADHQPELEGGWLRRAFMRHPWWFGIAFGLVFIPAIRPLTRHIPKPPPVEGQLPAFALVDSRGQAVTDADLRGTVWIADFVFTSCPSTCPLVTAAMVRLQERLAAADIPVQLVTITVDPDNDTPAVLAEYAAKHGADPTRWRFLTGEHAAVEALVTQGFRSALGDRRVNAAGMIDIAHTTKLVLIDGQGRLRGYYSSDELGIDEIYHRAQSVLREAREART